MKQMTIQDIHRVSLDIMDDVHQFCKSNNINYTLGYGSLLGAIRHKGFIPWDDDVDILMPRPDYEKFCTLFTSENNILISPLKGNSLLTFSRVADTKHTYVDTYTKWSSNINLGVWIDIFPVDGLPSDKREQIAYIKKCSEIYNLVCSKRMIDKFISNRELWSAINLWMHIFFHNPLFAFNKTDYISANFDKMQKTIDYNHSSFVGNICDIVEIEKQYCHPKNIYDNYIDVPFEDRTFSVISSYDQYLKLFYGDYMTLPPEDKRVTHSQHKYYFL